MPYLFPGVSLAGSNTRSKKGKLVEEIKNEKLLYHKDTETQRKDRVNLWF